MQNLYLKEANICVTESVPNPTEGSGILLTTYKVYEVNGFLPSFVSCVIPSFAETAGPLRLYNGSYLFENGGGLRHERKHIKITFKVDEEYTGEFNKWFDHHITTEYRRQLEQQEETKSD